MTLASSVLCLACPICIGEKDFTTSFASREDQHVLLNPGKGESWYSSENRSAKAKEIKGYDGTSGMMERKDFQAQGSSQWLKGTTCVQSTSAPASFTMRYRTVKALMGISFQYVLLNACKAL